VSKKEVPAAHMKANEQAYITIGSMEVLLNKIDELIVIENLAQSKMQEVEIVAAASNEGENSKPDSKYFQPRWCPSGMTKTQQHNLQRAHCKKIKQKV
jgi:hypothetical protein